MVPTVCKCQVTAVAFYPNEPQLSALVRPKNHSSSIRLTRARATAGIAAGTHPACAPRAKGARPAPCATPCFTAGSPRGFAMY